jgi:hypothetical protein
MWMEQFEYAIQNIAGLFFESVAMQGIWGYQP